MTQVEDRTARLAQRNFFEELLVLRDEQRSRKPDQEILVDGDALPWELNRQGYMRWYMAPTMEDIVLQTYVMYVQRIPPRSRSGKQLAPGHQLGFIWKGGSGYSIIDEERYDWDHWDLLQIPIRPKGCVVQHFNPGDEPIEIMFCSLNTSKSLSVDRGPGLEQIEDCPEWREQRGRG